MRKAIRCLTLALFVWTASAFAPSYISFVRTKSVALNMSTGEATKIEVVSQPDQNFLEKKGYVYARKKIPGLGFVQTNVYEQ